MPYASCANETASKVFSCRTRVNAFDLRCSFWGRYKRFEDGPLFLREVRGVARWGHYDLRASGCTDVRILLRRRLEAPESYFAKLPLRSETCSVKLLAPCATSKTTSSREETPGCTFSYVKERSFSIS
jgi:hypothetical protein